MIMMIIPWYPSNVKLITTWHDQSYLIGDHKWWQPTYHHSCHFQSNLLHPSWPLKFGLSFNFFIIECT